MDLTKDGSVSVHKRVIVYRPGKSYVPRLHVRCYLAIISVVSPRPAPASFDSYFSLFISELIVLLGTGIKHLSDLRFDLPAVSRWSEPSTFFTGFRRFVILVRLCAW